MAKQLKITAIQILDLLKSKHWEDLFLDEVKNGSSDGGHLRLDAWAMKKSWSNPISFGYEIKVSRSDFINDNKAHLYMEYCTNFYYVCPSGLISVDEIPDGCGLLWVAKTGTRLFTKKKAMFRDQQIPEDFYRYILMCRVKPNRGAYYEQTSNEDYWKEWLDEKQDKRILGRSVSKKLKRAVEEKCRSVELESRKVLEENNQLSDIKRWFEELGVPTNSWRSVCDFKNEYNKITNGFAGSDIFSRLKGLQTELCKFIESQESKGKNAKGN